MTPTRPSTLLALIAGFGVLGYLLADLAYGDLPALPRAAAVSVALLAVLLAGGARIVRDRVQRRRAGRPLSPLQIARAAALAKASSPVGAALVGGYGGLFAWTAPRRNQSPALLDDAVASGASMLAAAALVVGALLLERACRTPPAAGPGPDPDDPRLGSDP